MTSGGKWGARQRWRPSTENGTAVCPICLDLHSCIEQGVGLNGLTGPFQLKYSVILNILSSHKENTRNPALEMCVPWGTLQSVVQWVQSLHSPGPSD